MNNNPVRIQRNIAFLAIFLLAFKMVAWLLTGSVAIFTDALESIVNVVAGLFGWYSLWLAAKPRDANHPYGHGKVEFISAAIEGTLISIAGLVIIIESVKGLGKPHALQKLDIGLVLVAFTAVVNYIVGTYAINTGRKNRSATMEASGRHLRTDTYSTIGIVVGLVLIRFTGWLWLDGVVAIVFAIIILVTGYRVLRNSISGIMDEADMSLLEEAITYVNEHRRPAWIDLHNLRIIRYGNVLHLDGHLTVPWYYTVVQAHEEMKALEDLVVDKYGTTVELFIHLDPCEPFSCPLCTIENCTVRKVPFRYRIEWDIDNVMKNSKHLLDGDRLNNDN
ncbi:Ferrous-iron efflux pump FieF [compost metagenome]